MLKLKIITDQLMKFEFPNFYWPLLPKPRVEIVKNELGDEYSRFLSVAFSS